MSPASDRSPSSGCLMDHYDIRDYALADALQAVSQGRSEELEFATFTFGHPKEKVIYLERKYEKFDPSKHNESETFDKYPIKKLTTPSQVKHLRHSEVFVPLKPLKPQQPRFGVGVVNGRLVLVDETNQVVGNLVVSGSEITVAYEKGQKPIIYNKGQEPVTFDEREKEAFLYLGSGFRKYELETRYWSPVEKQGESLPTPLEKGNRYYPDPMCGANAGVALLEYFERAAEGKHLNASRLFLHQAACQLMGVEPTSGVSIRAIVKAMTRFGVAPEENWPYDLSKLETKDEPSSLCYSYARNYRATSYLSLERPGMNKDALIAQIKILVYSGLPVIFGFSIYDSIDQSFDREKDEKVVYGKGKIPFPTYGEIREAGHAAVIVGYDDELIIANLNLLGERDQYKIKKLANLNSASLSPECREKIVDRLGKSLNSDVKVKADIGLGEVVLVQPGDTEKEQELVKSALVTKGAFKIRNSWGKEWGEEGYGWLPYAYATHEYAFDFWTILKFEWMDRDTFGPIQRGDDLVICDKVCIGSGH